MNLPVRIVLDDASKAKLNRATSNLKKEINKALFQHQGIQGKLAKLYRKMLIYNITTQKHITSRKHTKRYKDWKKKYGIGRGKRLWWILFGDLLKNINTWKVDDGFKSGINAYVVSSGGASWQGKGDKGVPKPIAMYARILEFGEKKQPMFTPTLNEFIPIWRAEWFQALDNIGKVWK